MLDTVLSFACDLDRGVDRTAIRPALLTGDKQAHTFRIAVRRSGADVALSGAGASGYFIRADGVTVPITGSVSGSAASVTLTEGCYNVPGRFQLVVKLALAGETSAVFWADGAVAASSTDAILDEEGVIPSLDELLAQIAATEAAAVSATEAASSATSAASRANTAAASVEGMRAAATTLSPGSQATAAMTTVDGVKLLTIGVPQGLKGDKGDKGDPGNVATVNGVAPVAGNVTLTAGDVGALPSGGTAADASLLGGKAPSCYLSPHNWVGNSSFRINQRGQSSYAASGYTVDRWKIGDGTIEVHSSYLSIIATESNACVLKQFIDDLPDGTYTFAAKVSGVIKTRVVTISEGTATTIDSSNASYTSGYLTLERDTYAGKYFVTIRASAGYTVVVAWSALYEGSYTAATLPTYVPRGYAAELAECQRYYRRYTGALYSGVATGANSFACAVDFSGMRVVPSVASADVAWMRIDGTVIASDLSVSSLQFNRLNVQSGTAFSAYSPGAVYFNELAISADL